MTPLRRSLADGGALIGLAIHGGGRSVPLGEIAGGTGLGGSLAGLADRNVLVATDDQLMAGLALIELDGLARRIVVCPPDLKPDHLGAIVASAAIDAVVTDRDPATFAGRGAAHVASIALPIRAMSSSPNDARDTEWVLLTSGTTGVPKMVIHSREGLTGAIAPKGGAKAPVWGTFYDIRRYGGLQIFLRAILGRGSLVLSCPGEAPVDHLRRLALHGVTHQTGTPSHWRRVLMSPEATLIDPDYVRLSGEIADQAILDALRRTYPRARIGHAYASTEAGVGFEVDDEREGFPAGYLDRRGDVEMKIEDGSLRIRSTRTASGYVNGAGPTLLDAAGWVDTDDMVGQRGDRCYFVGRRSGIINVGGLKVHPEEVEAVINRHDRVRMSLVKPRANPITGAIVVADVVLADGAPAPADPAAAAIKGEILALCRAELPQHKVPVLVRFIDRLDVTAAGKLARAHA